jgi:uncharacterized protein YukE
MQNEEVGLARVEPTKGGLATPSARKRKSRKEGGNLEKIVSTLVVETEKEEIFTDAVLMEIVQALECDQEDRTEYQMELLEKAKAFRNEFAAAVASRKRQLDDMDTQLFEKLDSCQRAAFERISNSFNAQYASYNNVVRVLNTMPEEIASMMDTVFGGESPNY